MQWHEWSNSQLNDVATLTENPHRLCEIVGDHVRSFCLFVCVRLVVVVGGGVL